MAFIGRYGHQPIDAVMALPMDRMQLLADQLAELLREEDDAVRSRRETDG